AGVEAVEPVLWLSAVVFGVDAAESAEPSPNDSANATPPQMASTTTASTSLRRRCRLRISMRLRSSIATA
ncbi:MAG: hypothetical protein QOI17_859, partial [Gaiellales bacterium]|nr:hypothetical protein [Gaiellales bacterium]